MFLQSLAQMPTLSIIYNCTVEVSSEQTDPECTKNCQIRLFFRVVLPERRTVFFAEQFMSSSRFHDRSEYHIISIREYISGPPDVFGFVKVGDDGRVIELRLRLSKGKEESNFWCRGRTPKSLWEGGER
jgi:hypothetical protein